MPPMARSGMSVTATVEEGCVDVIVAVTIMK